MIEINLLPPELKKKPSPFSGFDLKSIDISNIPILKIAAGIGALVVALQVALIIIAVISGIQLSSATNKYNSLQSEKKEADMLKAKAAGFNKRAGAIDELMVKRFSWARKMNLLSDSVTPGVWLSEVFYDERPSPGKAKGATSGSLVIAGYVSSVGEQGTAVIGKFIQSLQENKEFYKDISSVDLVSTKSDRIDNQDVMSFKINCMYK